MTNTTIFAITILTTFIILGTNSALAAGSEGEIIITGEFGANAIPDWVKFNMRSYLDEQISERELLDAFDFLKKQGIMHESQEAAQEMTDLREENTALKKKLDVDGIVGPKTWGATDSPVDEHGRVKVQFHWDQETEQEALHHLRKAYDLNPALQTRVIQFDSNHDKWIGVLSIDWGSTSSKDCSAAEGSSDENSSCWIRVSQTHAGDPDRPLVTGHVYNSGEEIYPDEYGSTSSSGDMSLKRSKIHENSPADDRPTEEVAFYYNKISSASETVHDLVNNGETSTTGWDEGVAAFTSKNYDTTTDGTHELGHALGMMNNAIEKEILAIQGEISILEELMDMYTSTPTTTTRASTQYSESDFQFIQRHSNHIDNKIQSLQVGLRVLEDALSSVGDDAQLSNMDLQNAMQENQDTLDSLKDKITQINDEGEFWFTDLVPGS